MEAILALHLLMGLAVAVVGPLEELAPLLLGKWRRPDAGGLGLLAGSRWLDTLGCRSRGIVEAFVLRSFLGVILNCAGWSVRWDVDLARGVDVLVIVVIKVVEGVGVKSGRGLLLGPSR